MIAGIVLGFVNAVIRPVLIVLTFPFTLVTLGLFIFIVNAICLALTAWLVPGFSISGFGSALGGALVVSLVSWVVSALWSTRALKRCFCVDRRDSERPLSADQRRQAIGQTRCC